MGKPKAIIDKKKCLACCGCISVCPQDAIFWTGYKAEVDQQKCISCAICIRTCPIGAICGEVYQNEI
jgi:ferredoxin